MAGNGCAGWANISSHRKSRLRKPQTAGGPTESSNICSNIFDHLCRNGSRLPETHQTQRSRLSRWNLRWAFLHRAVNTALRFQSRQCFGAEELKSFFSLSTFLLIYDDWLLLTSRPESPSLLLLPCRCCCSRLGETKGYFRLSRSSTAPPPLAM